MRLVSIIAIRKEMRKAISEFKYVTHPGRVNDQELE